MIHFETEKKDIKMNTIGLRVSASEVTYAIYDNVNKVIISVDEIIYPKALDAPEALKYIRNTILDIIRENKISRAGIRTTEPMAHSFSVERTQIEGVIQEALASSTVERHYHGPIAVITARIGIPREDFKKSLGKDGIFPQIENWNKNNDKEREAILTALGAVNA
jgi:hypothetical protein